jgi:hypothetical protein
MEGCPGVNLRQQPFDEFASQGIGTAGVAIVCLPRKEQAQQMLGLVDETIDVPVDSSHSRTKPESRQERRGVEPGGAGAEKRLQFAYCIEYFVTSCGIDRQFPSPVVSVSHSLRRRQEETVRNPTVRILALCGKANRKEGAVGLVFRSQVLRAKKVALARQKKKGFEMDDFLISPSDCLVYLHVVAPSGLSGKPREALADGWLDRMVEVTGRGELVVRARMIVGVHSTDYRTPEGLPVSAVSLCRSDSVLALGPDWALRRLAAGIQPEFEREVSSLKDDLLRYRELAIRATALPSAESSASSVEAGLMRLEQFSMNSRADALAFVDQVIRQLEAFIAECQKGTVPWWFFWTGEATARRRRVGLPPRIRFDGELLYCFLVSKHLI